MGEQRFIGLDREGRKIFSTEPRTPEEKKKLEEEIERQNRDAEEIQKLDPNFKNRKAA